MPPPAAAAAADGSPALPFLSAAAQPQPFTPTPAEGWWGSKMFASAGRLEGMEEEEQQQQDAAAAEGSGKRKRTAFNEDTQADLYNRLQAAQRQGKRGMGKAAVKIAGAFTSGGRRAAGWARGWLRAARAGPRVVASRAMVQAPAPLMEAGVRARCPPAPRIPAPALDRASL
jgi:hypothetical protein